MDIVTADGRLRHASAQEEPELFWTVRGGGDFGVVTVFDFALHPLGPTVTSGLLIHPIEHAPTLLGEYRRPAEMAPDDLTCWAVMRQAPAGPFIPESWHGKSVVIFALCHCGDMEAGAKAVQPFRELGQPIVDLVGPHLFVDWQAAFDPLLTPGARNYWKSHDLKDLTEEACAMLLDAVSRLPSKQMRVFIGRLGRQVSRIPCDATAFARRDAEFIVDVHTRWRDPTHDSACTAWARALFDALTPCAIGAVYANSMPEDEPDRVRAAYGANYDRLIVAKRRYDPKNLFRLNQNIAC